LEYIPEAIEDAKANAKMNDIDNASFYAGDIKDLLSDEFVKENGKPQVIITDPPRAGMHKEVVEQIMKIQPEKIVYISCNAATQARDIALMATHYQVQAIQPVDMFPHTHHVENIALLLKK
jgi:23S rRNA (uracil1939-C5)-methyltransferase